MDTLGNSETGSVIGACTVDAKETTAEENVRNGGLLFIQNVDLDSTPSVAASADLQCPTAKPWV